MGFFANQDIQQRGFTNSIRPHNTNAVIWIDDER